MGNVFEISSRAAVQRVEVQAPSPECAGCVCSRECHELSGTVVVRCRGYLGGFRDCASPIRYWLGVQLPNLFSGRNLDAERVCKDRIISAVELSRWTRDQWRTFLYPAPENISSCTGPVGGGATTVGTLTYIVSYVHWFQADACFARHCQCVRRPCNLVELRCHCIANTRRVRWTSTNRPRMGISRFTIWGINYKVY